MADPTVIQAADVRAPSGSAVPTKAKTLAGTGTTEDTNDTALTDGAMATLLVGSAAVRIAWHKAAGSGSEVATTDVRLPAGGRIDWLVDSDFDDFVSVEAADGASAYEAWVWTSSGPRKAA